MAKVGGNISVATTERDGEIGELMGTLSVACEAPAIAHENSEYMTALEGGVASSCDTRSEEERRARVEWLEQLRSECGSDEEQFETLRSRPTWTEVASSSTCSMDGPSSAELERLHVENQLHFQRLVETHPFSPNYTKPFRLGSTKFQKLVWTSPFSFDFWGRLEVGRKIGGGGQAEIYEPIYDGEVEENFVLKVFRSDSSLADLQRTWVTEIGSSFTIWKGVGGVYVNCCFAENGTLLNDGRFVCMMERCWGDLRKAIDFQIKDKTHHRPPFPFSITMKIMGVIADGMRVLHENGILHRDLKAANVLLTHDIVDGMRVLHENGILHRDLKATNMLLTHDIVEDYLRKGKASPLRIYVADFESCKGILGTGFCRAPEILHALKNKVENKYLDPEIWTEKVDVYSYAMTCYEVLTGCIPFQNRAANEYDEVIGGERPPLPDYVDLELQELVKRCWHSKASLRLSFEEIRKELDIFILKSREFYKGLA